ncbi:L-fuculose-phosphate aldolase [Micromonospora nigra]|uniref:L-fuculose-phosphate aldolase n=1 Tax=Micromonospora nigra TaxID=145857 RepID=A0A1C6RDH6_9ACTN|nr:class II aldolase/adducin family protein [Micromonospora nigra]SCL15013.1 L-fuculose-phosphate aldolase [Micromonospora nigra]
MTDGIARDGRFTTGTTDGAETDAELLDDLISCGRAVVSAGLVRGSGGNLSARRPGTRNCWVTATGTWLDRLTPDDFSLVDIETGAVLAGNRRPTSEVLLHLASYRARPDANALIHLHPQLSVLLDAMGEPIRLVTIDHAYYLREVRSTPFTQSGTAELAQVAAAAVRDGANCVILGHHGCSVLGDGLELALKRALNLEEAATATYRALMLGRSVPECPPEYLERITAAEAGSAAVGAP